ncbi:STAS domain-containing protein [Symbioplanes lichenis]|uniref:STAS domain-containing protein n=1 Tax=Symbioplanes lichenis TaxID=1629072 RepID=UPI002738E019|nr:STAS domain-containing protein [Actinoplanes lichenis]
MNDDILVVRTEDAEARIVVLTASGELDRDTVKSLAVAADDALGRGRDRIVLDVGRVTFCDSSGLSLIVGLHRRAAASGGVLRVACAQGIVLTALQISNLDRLLYLDPTLEAALHAVRSGE